MDLPRTYAAFADGKLLVASSSLPVALTKAHARAARAGADAPRPLIFEEWSGRSVEISVRGTLAEVLARVPPPPPSEVAPRGPGRPKLGVVAREVTLLPRHWEWLEEQPSGASAALRRLVDDARKRAPGEQHARRLRDAAGKIMWALAGDLPDFEEASRALYALDVKGFEARVATWPKGLREYFLGRLREALRERASG